MTTLDTNALEAAIGASIKALEGYKLLQGKFGDTAARVAIPAAIETYLASCPKSLPERKLQIMTGVAGGALNGTVYAEEIAASSDNPYDASDKSFARYKANLDKTVDAYVKAAIKSYNTTRSQSLPDELKAIAERANELDDMEGTIPPDMLQAYFNWAHEDRDFLLSFIPDVVRACVGVAENVYIAKASLATFHRTEGNEDGMDRCNSAARAAETIKDGILSILDHPIKSESKIREEERERCAVYLEGCAQGLESGWEDSTPPAENTASANVLRIHAAMLRNGNAS